MLKTHLLISSAEMLFQASWQAIFSWDMEVGVRGCDLMRYLKRLHMFSRGLRSGEVGGCGKRWIWLRLNQFRVFFATWHRALSCWKNIKLLLVLSFLKKSRTGPSSTCSVYRSAVIPPPFPPGKSSKTRGPRWLSAMQDQTMTFMVDCLNVGITHSLSYFSSSDRVTYTGPLLSPT